MYGKYTERLGPAFDEQWRMQRRKSSKINGSLTFANVR
jgi:hypothetical protein